MSQTQSVIEPLITASQNFHTHITEKWGVPVWMSYISFALFTIFVGLLFGLVSRPGEREMSFALGEGV